jgi:ribosome-binding protein aMBF1 (putative translation factor)
MDQMDAEHDRQRGGGPTGRRHDRYLPGFGEMASRRRRQLAEALVARRIELGLSQTEVAARMGTSQSAVARLESGAVDVRLSSLERYAAAVDQVLDWKLGGAGGD